ncbi:MAG: hypothetical protein M3R61_10965, partial [Chloroflexota bacterium]|nr:hypothetical protein [Chloroflexota bacterium]
SAPLLPGTEVYSSTTNTWTPGTPLATPRWGHTATLLPDGRVLVAGGNVPIKIAEIYDPASGEWSTTGPMKEQREAHTATLLLDGRVLVAGTLPFGGSPYPAPGFPSLLPSTEVYSSTTNTWATGAPMSTPRWDHTATLLPDGRVIMIGGYSWYGQVQASVEIFDPASDRWYAARPLSSPRANHTATLLADGTILVVGGDTASGSTNTAERYDPSDAQLGMQQYLSSFIRKDVPTISPPTFVPSFPTPTRSP